MLRRAYSILQVKAVDDERRVITGVATTPEPDRIGDVIEPLGVAFKNPLPLLLFHNNTKPVGRAVFSRPTADGIEFEASIPAVTEPGVVKDRTDEAWHSIKYRLITGVSIGFRADMNAVESLKSGGLRFKKSEVVELSLVPIPANASATIHVIRSLATQDSAASGTGPDGVVPHSPADVGTVVRTSRKGATRMTISENIKSFEASRQAKAARMSELMTKAGETGQTLDATQSEEYDGLDVEVKEIDKHLGRLSVLETANKAAARPVNGASAELASASRGGHVVSVTSNVPPGYGFARVALCKMAAYLAQGSASALDFAKARYPDDARIQQYLKAAVPAGTTTDAVWASPLVDHTNLASEFIEYLRPMTIIGRIPGLRRIPFMVRIIGQTSGGTGYWVGQGAPKPLTSYAFNAVTHGFSKVAAIAVITDELARFSSPSADGLVRDALAGSLIERVDIDFIDPTSAAVANVQPASITNGVVPLTSAGTSADNVRTDIQNLLEAFLANNVNPAGLVLIMPNTLALALSLLVNDFGQREFPDITMNGGSLLGIPVVTSQYAANASGAGNLVIAVNAPDIFLSDDGQVTVDASREASLQMLDNPTNNSATATATTMVSMFQTNSLALRAERQINWSKRRPEAVVYMDDANWGAIGSP